MEKEGDVAAVIAEPIRWGGYIPPKEYWRRIRQICDEFGALLIFDEIPFSLGRTGHGLFACNFYHESSNDDGISPDVLVLGKGLGGGILPLSAVIMRSEFNDAIKDIALGHYTHEKNPLLCRAGLATLEFIQTHNLVAHSKTLGDWTLRQCTTQLSEKYRSIIYDIRGIGLFVCIELRDQHTGDKLSDLTDRVMYECLTRGLSFKVTNGNVIVLCPPLIVTQEQMQQAIDIIDQSIDKCWQNH
ncbi:4-aminobutyrate aminotransferase [Reticulomyxa filosa]|uniref:4-aminobutyrate aminotransferase n=1 Tax=Reticulomyxa filosa TaxID=46433 RepID=X6MJ74_RETFI|nr:4-aminobutyrate aminotransferase [Reticulomyxa filosa]|eukprot:ETO13884.1 4-aminobutyrate aminotransferase [Reticulomyxa filosa]